MLRIAQENARLNRKIIESKSSIKDTLFSKTNGFAVLKKAEFEPKKINHPSQFPDMKNQEDIKAKTNEDFFKLKRIKKKFENMSESKMNNTSDDKLVLPKMNDEILEEKFSSKILYKRKAFINNLALVDLKFMIYAKK